MNRPHFKASISDMREFLRRHEINTEQLALTVRAAGASQQPQAAV